MVLNRIATILGSNNEPAKTHSTNEKQTADSTDKSETEETIGISRPPGWEPLYGTYDKPVYTNNTELIELIESVVTAADVSDVETSLPPMGTNKEHIQLEIYSLSTDNRNRTLVVEVYIEEFSSWTPEEKENWTYPAEVLGSNGPYYMHLEDDLEEAIGSPPFGFKLISYDSDEDVAIYAYEKPLHPLREGEGFERRNTTED